VRFENYPLEFRPSGKLLVLENLDKPGVVGKVGTLLAESNVNIADIHLARRGQEALAVLRLDQEPTPELVERLEALPEVKSARRVLLG
jgi:D-3-phosphoglycerate dehydrogenase